MQSIQTIRLLPRFQRADLVAGFVVFLVALPLCLGITLAAGAPLSSGLVAGIVGGVFVAPLSRSRFGVSGPTASLSVIVYHALTELGDFSLFAIAVSIAGCIQVVLGLSRVGFLIKYIPAVVIHGMLAGVGAFLMIKQLPYLIGYQKEMPIHFGVCVLSVLTVAIMLVWSRLTVNRLWRHVPSALILIAIGVIFSHGLRDASELWAFQSAHLVSIPELSVLKESIHLPDMHAFTRIDIWKIAVIIAIIASIESLLSVEALDQIAPNGRINSPNQELKAQGFANFISGLLGGLPVASVIIRGTVNIRAGAQSRNSAFLHGVYLALALFLIPSVLNMIPYTVLAVILISAGHHLMSFQILKKYYQADWREGLTFFITFFGVLAIDLLSGVCIAVLFWYLFPYVQRILRRYSTSSSQIPSN